jgi:uncharacterized protein (UPF0305 family)
MSEKDLEVFTSLGRITSRAELAEALAGELAKFTIVDLQLISSFLEREIIALPSPYREQIRPYFVEQYFTRYHQVLSMYRQGGLARLDGEISDLKLFGEFCAMAAGFRNYDSGSSAHADLARDRPFSGLFYFLLSGFYMFVLDEPGHPVGMPFPGGFAVKKQDGRYLCPIRDKEKDVEYSICNFCPAKQEEGI